MRNFLYFLLFSVLSLSGCSGLQSGSSGSSAQGASTQGEPAELSYLDQDYFDQALATFMKEERSEITLSFSKKFSTEQVPERLDKWLSAVAGAGGSVQLKPNPDLKGAKLTLLDMIYATYTLYETVQANLMYQPAGNYNAALIYTPDARGTIVEKVVFSHR